MTELAVAYEHIDIAGRGIQQAAADARGDLTAFQSELAAHDEPWGHDLNDQIGPLIGGCYGAIAAAAMACYHANTGELSRQGDAARTTAANYRTSDEATATAAGHIST